MISRKLPVMKTLRRSIAVSAFALFMTLGFSKAEAALYEYALTVTDTGAASFSGTGVIKFNSLAGTGTSAPAFDDFAFSVNTLDGAPSGQLPRSFDETMLSLLTWAIDPITFALSLDLDTNTQADGNRSWDLSFDNISPFATSVLCNSTTNSGATALACYAQNRNQEDVGSSLIITRITSTPTATVPEPGSLALLAAALLGLRLTRRRQGT